MNKKYINNKGIALYTLVVTIIVIIILATISLNWVFGGDGIINAAAEAKRQQEIAGITEVLELQKADVAGDEGHGSVPMDMYLEEIQESGKMPYEVTEIDIVDETYTYITIDDKYEYLLEQEDNGNLKIIFQGEIKELAPRIRNVEISNTTNSIDVIVTATRAEKYVFYIKEKDDTEYVKQEENETGKCSFKNLTQNTEYSIKVEAVNRNGQDEREIDRKTSEMVDDH